MAISVTTSSPDVTAAIASLTAAIRAHSAALEANTQALIALTSVQQEIEEELQPPAQSATLHLWTMVDSKGVAMPLTLQVNGPGGSIAPPPVGSAAGVGFQEWDGANGTGNQVAPIGPMQYTSAAPAIVAVDANGNLTAVAAGQAEVTALDTGNNLQASDLITVVDVAVSATLNAVANPPAAQVATKAGIAAAAAKVAAPKK